MEKIIFEYYNLENEYALESAWAEKIGDNYKLNNVLFYASGYSWGDIVEVEERSGELFVTGLVKESGHTTLRIIFYEENIIKPTMDQLEQMQCSWEGSNFPRLVSVDIAPEVDYTVIKKFLDEGERKDMWSYEESCLAHSAD